MYRSMVVADLRKRGPGVEARMGERKTANKKSPPGSRGDCVMTTSGSPDPSSGPAAVNLEKAPPPKLASFQEGMGSPLRRCLAGGGPLEQSLCDKPATAHDHTRAVAPLFSARYQIGRRSW